MVEISIGDFIIGKDYIWEIIAITKSGVDTLYDIIAITDPTEFDDLFGDSSRPTMPRSMKNLSRSHIRHLGEIVPRDSEKAIEILFSKS